MRVHHRNLVGEAREVGRVEPAEGHLRAPAPAAGGAPPRGAFAADTRGDVRTRGKGAAQVRLRTFEGSAALPRALVREAMRARVPVGWDLYTRAGDRTPDPSYHANAVEAAIDFARALEGRTVALDGAELLSVLRRAHRVAALGRAGDRPYLGLDRNYLEESYRPGELRGDDPFLRASGTRPQALDYVRRVLEDLGLGAPLGDGPVNVAGVTPTSTGPVNAGATHLYPLGGDGALQPFFDAAAVHLDGADGAGALGAIARYYHTLVNAKPFEQINNSLLMSQVNVLLVRAGHAPVRHGWLDHVAFRTSPEVLAAVFAAHVDGRVRAPSDFGLVIPS